MSNSILSNRVKTLEPSATVAIFTQAKEMISKGINVIDLSLGDPVLDPNYKIPEHIKKSAIDALNNKKISYTTPSGLPELRQAIADSIKKYNGIDYSVKDIIVSTGAKQSIFNAFLASINEGDEVILPCPSWVSYKDIVKLFGGVVKDVKTSIDNDFKITPTQLEDAITPKTKWLLINSPSNPTGSIYTKEELSEIAKVLHKYPNVFVMSDDIYQNIIFEQGCKFTNIVMVDETLKDRVLIIDGISKSHGMTGWRIGYGVSSNKDLISKMGEVQSQSISSACALSQYTAITAIKDDREDAKHFSDELYKKKELFISKITDDRIKINNPKGAYYVFVSIEGIIGKKFNGTLIDSCSSFCSIVLENLHIALTPGIAFGTPNHFRASLSASPEDVDKGASILNDMFSQIK